MDERETTLTDEEIRTERSRPETRSQVTDADGDDVDTDADDADADADDADA